MIRDEHSKPGESVLALGLAVWMSLAVGPWWVGVALYVAGFLVNLVVYARKRP